MYVLGVVIGVMLDKSIDLVILSDQLISYEYVLQLVIMLHLQLFLYFMYILFF